MILYRKDFPQLALFSQTEQEQLVIEAGNNARLHNSNFAMALDFLIHRRVITDSKGPVA